MINHKLIMILQADDLLFCYRWLLLEMKREFVFDHALKALEVTWSSLPPATADTEVGNRREEGLIKTLSTEML